MDHNALNLEQHRNPVQQNIGNLQQNINEQREQERQEQQRRMQLANDIKVLEQNKRLSDRDIVMSIIGKYDIAGGYPTEYPGTVPHEPTEAELEGKDKSEKKAIVRKYEEEKTVYDRRKAIYQNTVREMSAVTREYEAKEEEKKREIRRQEMRGFILRNEEAIAALSKASDEKDANARHIAFKEALRKIAEILINSDEYGEKLRDSYEGSVDNSESVNALRMFYAEQSSDAEYANASEIFGKIDEIEARYKVQETENIISRVINFEVTEILREEFQNDKGFVIAQNACLDDYSAFADKNQKDYNAIDGEVSQRIGLGSMRKAKDAYIKSARLEAFETAINKYRHDNPTATEAEARKKVLDSMRGKILAECEYYSYHERVEADSTEEDFKKKGGATYRKIVPASEAAKLVEKSNGFLCAQFVNKEKTMMEIKPSLPKKVNIKNKEYELRRLYKTFVKGLMEHFFDEEGNVRKTDRSKLMQDAHNIDMQVLGYYNIIDRPDEDVEVLLQEIMHSKKDSDEFLEILGATESPLFTEIVMENVLFSFISIEKYTDSNSEETKELKDKLKLLQIKNYGDGTTQAPSDEDIDKAIEECRADAEKAKLALLKVRNLDTNSEDIPILNACSANGNFVQTLYSDILRKDIKKTEFLIHDDYIDQKQLEGSNRIISNFGNLLIGGLGSEEAFRKTTKEMPQQVYDKLVAYRDLLASKNKENLDGEALTEDEAKIVKEGKRWLTECTRLFAKYDYHVAGTVNTDGDEILTTEGFAAETSQVMVEPFTMQGAVGTYHGGKDSFKDYYRLDDPFNLSPVNMLKARIKFLINQ